MALVDISLIEPDDLAGDKFDDVDAVGSMLEESAMDSLELHEDELATDVGGSSFKDFLKHLRINIKFNVIVIYSIFTCTDRLQRYFAALQCSVSTANISVQFVSA